MKQSCPSVPNSAEVHRHTLLSWHGTDSIAFPKSVILVAHATALTSPLFDSGCTEKFLYRGPELLEYLTNLIKRILAPQLQSFAWPDFCSFT